MDLSGLSVEEAALITDVLSRLSLGSSPAASIVPQNTPSHHEMLQDQALMELDQQCRTLEQELQGLNSASSLNLRAVPRETCRPANPSYQGSTAFHEPYMADGFGGEAQSPVAYGPAVAPSRWRQEAGGEPQSPAPGPPLLSSGQLNRTRPSSGSAQQFQLFDLMRSGSSLAQREGPGEHAFCSQEAQPLRRPSSTELPGSPTEESCANGTASPATPAPPQPISLLKEMRERLRQQQSQQVASPGAPADAGASCASSADGPTASGPGLAVPMTPQTGHYTRTGSQSAAMNSAAMAAARARRAMSSAPSSAAKAFTMLNARTTVDRYVQEAAETQASTPTKAPVRLPEHERSARLQQLYERTAKWRQRCDERYAKERQDRKASELEECTFTPKICTASHLIMQGKSATQAYMELARNSTPTKRDFAAPLNRPSPGSTSSSRGTPIRSAAGAAGSRSPQGDSTPTGHRTHAMAGKAVGSAAPSQSGDRGNGAVAAVSPQRLVVNGSQVGERLYQRACEQRARQEERFFQQLLEEERQRRFMASVQGVSPRVYDPPEPPSSRYMPSGMEECTFHPSTSATFNRRPKSAPHMRPEGRRHTLGSPLSHMCGPAALVGHDSTAGRSQSRGRATSVNTNISFGPDLDWEEFLARQERFLAMRQQKLQLLEQGEPAGPRMAPGSKKLLREREMRLSAVGQDALGQSGLLGEASSRTAASSPGPEERRRRTIMEMYGECTFQPQITRKAAALPGRHIEDFVEGGRSRREEWRQEQLALKQAREAEESTFKPQTFTKDAYSHVRPRINMKNPDPYLAHVADKRRQREALRAELDCEREALEMQQCTFKPQTTPLPVYLIRRLQEQHLQQLQADQTSQSVAWEESSGGLGDIDGGPTRSIDGSYADGTNEQLLNFQPFQPASGHTQAGQAVGPLDTEMSSYQDAYQRALQFASTLGQSCA